MVRCQSYCNGMSDIVYKTKIKFLLHTKMFNIIVFKIKKRKGGGQI